MPADNILVIAVDGLRAAALGAYGNTAFSTAALDQFAAESLLFDWWFADSVELLCVYRSFWGTESPLPGSLAAEGYLTTLVTDEPAVLSCEAAGEFDDCAQLAAVKTAKSDDISQTALARFFSAVCEQIESPSPLGPKFIWAHSRGMYGPWDAPLELQEPLLQREEGDPTPVDTSEPPDLLLDGASDPDAAFRWSCAYAAQVLVLDTCVEAVFQSIDEASSRGKWLVALCGTRGFPLGEHGRVGGVDHRLFAEQLHVPMLWRSPGGRNRLARSGQLASHADLARMIISRDRAEIRMPARDALFAVDAAGIRSIRTADWSLRCESAPQQDGEVNEPRCELFVRPDDRWEANDVASLCPDIVQQLLARLGQSSGQ